MKSFVITLFTLLGIGSVASGAFLADVLGWKCMAINSTCSVITECCGNGVCYYPAGIKTLKGRCVECVSILKMCHNDAQCCKSKKPLICLRTNPFYIEGHCSERFKENIDCYKNSQCASGICWKESWWYVYGYCLNDDIDSDAIDIDVEETLDDDTDVGVDDDDEIDEAGDEGYEADDDADVDDEDEEEDITGEVEEATRNEIAMAST